MTLLPVAPEVLAHIVSHPDDREAKLVYADALEAAGQGARAEFIRARIEMRLAEKDRFEVLKARADELLKAHEFEWLPGLSPANAKTHYRSYEDGFLVSFDVIHESVAKAWPRVLAECPIRELRFGTRGSEALLSLAESGDVSRLRSISIYGSEGILEAFANGDKPFTGLASLSLKSSLHSAHAAALGQTARFPVLEELTLEEGDVEGFDAFIGGPAFARLSRLIIEFASWFDDEAASALAGAPIARSLEQLTVWSTEMGDEGLEALARGHWEKLLELTLKANPTSEEGCLALGTSSGFPALKKLHVEDGGVTRKVLEALTNGELGAHVETLLIEDKLTCDQAARALLSEGKWPRLNALSLMKARVGLETLDRLKARYGSGFDASSEQDIRTRAAFQAEMDAKRAAHVAAREAAPPEVTVEIEDPNFKLALVSALRNAGKVPDLDKEEFFSLELDDQYDSEASYNYEIHDDIRDHLVATIITPEMALAVDALSWSGGNTIQHDIWNYWNGTTDDFDIHDLSGIEQFPNIRDIFLHLHQITSWAGVAVLPKLESLKIERGTMVDVGVFLGAPALKRLTLQYVAGKEDPVNQRGIAALEARGVEVVWR